MSRQGLVRKAGPGLLLHMAAGHWAAEGPGLPAFPWAFCRQDLGTLRGTGRGYCHCSCLGGKFLWPCGRRVTLSAFQGGRALP